jgi:hypothetical protein
MIHQIKSLYNEGNGASVRSMTAMVMATNQV